jgi:hypothetical protein
MPRRPGSAIVEEVFAKIGAILFVLGAVPFALWIGGYLPPPERTAAAESRPAFEPGLVEREWRDHVAGICAWERKRAQGIKKAFGRAVTPADALLGLDSAIRLGRSSLGIFRRLEPPFAYRREARQLRRLFEREQRAVVGLRDAIHAGERRAFFLNAKIIVAAEERKRVMLSDLGLQACIPQPPNPPAEDEATAV